MSQRIIECVPNFSEGRDKAVIRQITAAIEASGGVKLLDVDPGEATNRTVVTFVGEPEAVVEAAFAGVKRAAELIDMRRHKGAHPRMGATDVLPLIPIAGVTLAECAELARALARRIADELRIPTYCYEAAAFAPERKNLAVCRAGEYEALPEKLAHTASAPDFGVRPFDEGVARTGATTVGARDFLIAVNFNLNTTSTRRANAIAFDVREKGRPVREGNPITGRVVKDAAGNPVMQPGTLPTSPGRRSTRLSTRCAARPTPAACASRGPKSWGWFRNGLWSKPANTSSASSVARRASPRRRSSALPSSRWDWTT